MATWGKMFLEVQPHIFTCHNRLRMNVAALEPVFVFFSENRVGTACKVRVLQCETEIHLYLSLHDSSESSLGRQDGIFKATEACLLVYGMIYLFCK